MAQWPGTASIAASALVGWPGTGTARVDFAAGTQELGLVALSLTGTLTAGTASSGAILGATPGSTITSNVTGLAVNSGARTYAFDGSGAAGAIANGLIETLTGAIGSPRASAVTIASAALPPSTVTGVVLAQSEEDYVFNTGSFYRNIAQPTPGNGNLIVFTQSGTGAAPVRTVVNPTTVAAGEVNPAMAALSALLAYAAPGVQFVLGDGAVPGTGRPDLYDDSTDGSDDRAWSDFTSVVSAIEGEFGSVQNLIECWYNNDAGSIATFKASFWPFYFGANADGSAFALGSTHNGRRVDHCLFDASAATNAKGRGLFKRAETKWRVLTPMPFLGLPDSTAGGTELPNFSNDGAGTMRLREPARATMHALAGDTLAQSAGIEVGPSAHVCKFGGMSTDIHPDRGNPDGQVLLTWPIAVALLRAAGMAIGEPEIDPDGTTVASDGSWAEFAVKLPNGGTLKTLAGHRGTAYTGSAPHQQAVTGVEITRSGGARKPVFRTIETSYPASHRGTVTITDTGTGVGAARRGRVRITPSQPFASGDALSYLRGQANGGLLQPRDLDLYRWFLIEHVPALYDATATYPFEGIAVKPYQADLNITVAAAFQARSATFDGTDYYASGSVAVPAGAIGMASLWLRNTQTTWNVSTARIFHWRIGSTVVLELSTASSGRLTMRVNNDTATDTVTFYAAAGNTQFATNTWYHVLASWGGGKWDVYVNGVLMVSTAITTVDMAGQSLTQVGVGATSTGSGQWTGDLGHFYLNLAETLDFSVAANRAKFAVGGQPVNLGANGELPTGNVPAYYYDGAAPAFSNQGSAGNVTLTGALTAGGAPSYTP